MNTQASKSASEYMELMNDPEFRQQLRQQDKVALEKMGLEDRTGSSVGSVCGTVSTAVTAGSIGVAGSA